MLEAVNWDDLQIVDIQTTDERSFLPDVVRILHGFDDGCIIPKGATSKDKLLERLQALPDFRKDALIDAMSSPANGRFLYWQRTKQNA